MQIVGGTPGRILVPMLLLISSAAVSAQQPDPGDPSIVVNGRRDRPAAPLGPEIKGVVSARHDGKLKITGIDGKSSTLAIDDYTRIKAGAGLFGGGRDVGPEALINGLFVTAKTVQPSGGAGGDLVADRISFRTRDLKTATMIQAGTAERFNEQAATTEALRGRMGDIDKYNIKSTTDVHFDVGKADLSAQDKADLCTAASAAEKTENALILVVGYTDATGSDDLNQQLSEKRANRVINYLQQACRWKPYRMLTPTGMAKADPVASNATPEGKAQNRRVAVNVLVSKSVDGF